MTTVPEVEKPKILGRHKAADHLGVSSPAMLLLQRDGVLPPECGTCGKIWWKVEVLDAKREKVRDYLRTTYPNMVENLIVSD